MHVESVSARRIVRDISEAARDIACREVKTKAFLKSRDQIKAGRDAPCAFEQASPL